MSKNGKPGKQNPPQSDSSHKACQKDDDVETLEARQKDNDVETLEVDDVETLQSQKDDDVEILQTHITKKVRFNEESNIIHTFSSSSAPAANNEADHHVFTEAEAADATKEALTSATAIMLLLPTTMTPMILMPPTKFQLPIIPVVRLPMKVMQLMPPRKLQLWMMTLLQ